MALPTVFTSGDVFTAANANLLRSNQYNKTTSTKTADYVLVADDVGTRVLMNAAGTTTITVNTSLFAAGDTLEISNIGAGVCTITSGTCTVTSSSSLALAQYVSGTLFFTSASAAIFIASAVTATAGGLVPIVPTSAAVGSGSATYSATTGFVTVTAASSVSLNGVFTAAYDNYFFNFNLLAAAGSPVLNFRVRSAGTDLTSATYVYGNAYISTGAIGFQNGSGSGTSINLGSITTTSGINSTNIFAPFLTQRTRLTFDGGGNDASNLGGGLVSNTTSYDGFTITTPTSTFTGTISVYGYNQ